MMTFMFRFLGATVLVGLMAACSNAPIVRSDYDPRADFASYRTFAFMEPLGTDRAGYTTLLTERLKRAAALQMESRGYALDEKNPDLLINFQTTVQSRTEYVGPPPMMWGGGFGFGYGAGFYSGWPGYAFGPDVIQYNEGTMKVDLIDTKRRQMVWEGVGTSVIGDAQQTASDATVQNMMISIFARYPFLAGSRVVAPRK
ncbi:MAG: DUF4136 domain-containing protein [Burkholderiaceae bacterium]|nr:DUF4136 domain-containing protein [Burkholderiaceae bacterium]